MGKFFQDLFTEKDGKSWSLARVGWGATLFTCLFVVIWKGVVKDEALDLASVGILLTGVLAGGGAAIGFQAKTEGDVPT